MPENVLFYVDANKLFIMINKKYDRNYNNPRMIKVAKHKIVCHKMLVMLIL